MSNFRYRQKDLRHLKIEHNSEDVLPLENSNSNLNYEKDEGVALQLETTDNCMCYFFVHKKLKTYAKYWHLYWQYLNLNLIKLLFLLFFICWEQLAPHKYLERLNLVCSCVQFQDARRYATSNTNNILTTKKILTWLREKAAFSKSKPSKCVYYSQMPNFTAM